jgi:hypothetical protein
MLNILFFAVMLGVIMKIVMYTKCHIFIVMLSVIMLNVVPMSVVYEYRDFSLC